MTFNKYQHIEKIGTIETQGIENGVCYIFPKLDGLCTEKIKELKPEIF